MKPVVVALCVAVGLALVLSPSALGDVAGQECQSSVACFPWSNNGTASTSPCRRGSKFNLRFMVDAAVENHQVVNGHTYTQSIYAFCPNVDNLQSFSLRGAAFVAGGYQQTVGGVVSFHLTRSLSLSYLSVYGFGNSNNTLFPERGVSTGSVVFAQNGSSICVGGSSSVAVVTTLVLEIGLRHGLFNYAGATSGGMQLVANPNYNNETCWEMTHNASSSGSGERVTPAAALHTAVTLDDVAAALSTSSSTSGIDYCSPEIEVYVGPDITQPLKTGFVPTCDVDKYGDDRCIFDDSQICIGNPGQKNCAKCYSTAQELAENATVQVWASYYGTDSRDHILTSGGSNPINFREFAQPNMLSTISSKLHSLWLRNYSAIFGD